MIDIGLPVVDGGRVTVPIATEGAAARRLIRADFWAEYEDDLDGAPPGLLLVPVVANLLPVAWVEDFELRIPVLDAEYSSSIDAIRTAWHETYPVLDLKGTVVVERTTDAVLALDPDASLALFSGGLDSLATALAHEDERLTLTPIWGVDVEADDPDAWLSMKERVDEVAIGRGIEVSVIRSNFRRFVYDPALNARHAPPLGNWWRSIVGIVLPAMTAPVAWARRASRVHIAASHTAGFGLPHGTNPDIDTATRFAGVEVIHDGFESNRLQKIAFVTAAMPDHHLLVCSSGSATGAGNCMKCMKCLRTMASIVVVGGDPRRHGFAVTDRSFPRLQRMLATGSGFAFNEHEEYFWGNIQEAAAGGVTTSLAGGEEFFAWLAGQDIAALRASASPDRIRRMRKALARLIPARLRPIARRVYLKLFGRW